MASEIGRAQTRYSNITGVRNTNKVKVRASRTTREGRPKKVKVLYTKAKTKRSISRVVRDTRNLVWKSGDHPVRLNTTWWPIVMSTVRERWKEPREGSETEPETVSLQADRAPYECDVVLFVERAGELRCDARLSVKDTEPKRKRIWRGWEVSCRRPETEWPNHEQVEAMVKRCGGPNTRLLK